MKKKKAKEAKEEGGRKSKQSSIVSGNCNDISCLNDMLEVLKIDKDMVQNYIEQKKRLDARLSLAGKNGDKSGDFNETMKLLNSSIGGGRALARNSPICAGRYNSTKAEDGAKLLLNISKCDKKIQEACNISISKDTSSGFEECSGIMMDFRVKVDIIKTENWAKCCFCWANLKALIPAIKNCSKGNSSSGDKIKDKEKAIGEELKACKSARGTCRKYQDQTISYIATCTTSTSSLKKVLEVLYQSKDMMTKVNSKINE